MTTREDKATIVLTNRPPIRISRDKWPIIASAEMEDYDGEFRFQSFRTTDWAIRVRQHSDGRTIIYAIYDHVTAWQNERCRTVKHGILLGTCHDGLEQDIVSAVHQVCDMMPDDDDSGYWQDLANQCIAELPAVDIDDDDDN